MERPCPFCETPIADESYEYVHRSRAARERDDRVRIRCPHCTETVVVDYDDKLIDPDAAANARADAEDDERRYGPENAPSDLGEG